MPSITLCRELDIPDRSTEAEAIIRVKEINERLRAAEARAANFPQADPDLTKFVPRPDYDAALNRASTAEARLAEIEKMQLNQQIETTLTLKLLSPRLQR